MHQTSRATQRSRGADRHRVCLCTYSSSPFSSAINVSCQTEIRIDASGSYYEVSSTPSTAPTPVRKLQQAQINLNDCLACRQVSCSILPLLPLTRQKKWVHYVGRVGLDHATITRGGAGGFGEQPGCGFTRTQGPSVVDRTTKSGVARGDVVVIERACRTATGSAARARVLHRGAGLCACL